MQKLFFSAIIAPDAKHPDPRRIALTGREAWALLNLVEAGVKGCTPITAPGPRWSHYVWLLRGDGFKVETLHEDHAGPFAGSHARYLLHDVVTLEGGNLAEWRPDGVRYPEDARRAAA